MTPREALRVLEEVERRFGDDRSPLFVLLEAVVEHGEHTIARLEAVSNAGPENVSVDGAEVLLERALEAHGMDLNDPILTGLRALSADLWTLYRSIPHPSDEGRIALALDRLAQRAELLVTMANGRAT